MMCKIRDEKDELFSLTMERLNNNALRYLRLDLFMSRCDGETKTNQ